MRAAALALRHHPNVNASWGAEAISQHGEVHIGIAVATPEGLITPVIRNADEKSILGLARAIHDPSLEIAYFLKDGTWVDVEGRDTELPLAASGLVLRVAAGRAWAARS